MASNASKNREEVYTPGVGVESGSIIGRVRNPHRYTTNVNIWDAVAA